ncbi:AlpA family transcriptional regulator [Pseudomonadales bacterium]|nr:AlpA family transcriptional regulator [Pseudomonadales bacterium]
MKHNNQMQFLRLPQVMQQVGLSKPQLYKLIARNQFPSQIKICSRISVWLESDVVEWMQEQVLRHQEEPPLDTGREGATHATQWPREVSP